MKSTSRNEGSKYSVRKPQGIEKYLPQKLESIMSQVVEVH